MSNRLETYWEWKISILLIADEFRGINVLKIFKIVQLIFFTITYLLTIEQTGILFIKVALLLRINIKLSQNASFY